MACKAWGSVLLKHIGVKIIPPNQILRLIGILITCCNMRGKIQKSLISAEGKFIQAILGYESRKYGPDNQYGRCRKLGALFCGVLIIRMIA